MLRRDDKWYSCDDEVVSEINSRTPPLTDKPFRPIVDASAKRGTIDSYFDKTPAVKPAARQSNGNKDEPVDVDDDDDGRDTIRMGRTRAGKIVQLNGTNKRP